MTTLPLVEELTLTRKELHVNTPTSEETVIASQGTARQHSLCNKQPGCSLLQQ